MNKVIILGPCGSGKSTYSKLLAETSKLPLFHLDQHFFLPNWQEKPRLEWIAINKKLVQGNRWIIEGNYGSTMEIRINAADTIIYLDTSTFTSMWRVIKRTIRFHGRQRPDCAEGCNERWDVEFLHYVLTFNFVKKPKILNRIKKLRPDLRIIQLKSQRERDEFLENLIKN